MADFRLKVFVSVAHNLNFTKASKELGISQPAISKHIQELENQFQTKLFLRANNKISLTDTGKTLLLNAQDIMRKEGAMEYEMNCMTDNFTGELRISAAEGSSRYILPRLIAGFVSLNPSVKISLSINSPSTTEVLLKEGRADVGIIGSEMRSPGFLSTPIINEKILVVCNNFGKFNHLSKVTLEEIPHLPLIINSKDCDVFNVPGKYNLILEKGRYYMQVDDYMIIKRIVRCMDILALLPELCVKEELRSGILRAIPIKGITPERQISFVTCQGKDDPVVAKFIDYTLNNNLEL